MSHRVTLYTKPGCHLCESVEQILQRLEPDFDLAVETIDINSDPALAAQFHDKVPVVVIDDQKMLAAPIHVADLYAALS